MVGKNFILALAGGLGALVAFFALPGLAQAQCGSCAPPAPTPPCCTPAPPCCHTPTPPPVSPPCCVPGHNVNIPGVNVFVGASVIVNTQVNAQASAAAQASGGATVFFGGGGGGGGVIAPSTTGIIQGLNVEGGQGVRRVAYEATRIRTRRVVIQAFCFDDLNSPHPASQVIPGRDIDDAYDGELYRCIAGTHLQYTIAEWSGRADFSGGETVTCRRGEALYHVPGHFGGRGHGDGDDVDATEGSARVTLECRPQRPARDCNERSLLRRYGAGIKVLTMIRIEHYQAFREEHYQTSSSTSSSFSMDGGVGGIAY